uniref:Uncharacterized protein n=1 Tax=Rhizophora mucronata TaxID=61149 RepID=A0A2P2NUQ7_RHIMU
MQSSKYLIIIRNTYTVGPIFSSQAIQFKNSSSILTKWSIDVTVK